MFAPRYFATSYYAPRYFPPDSEAVVELPGFRPAGGGMPGMRKSFPVGKRKDISDDDIIAVIAAFLEIVE